MIIVRFLKDTMLRKMANVGLLVLSHPSKVEWLLPMIREHVKNTLYIYLSPFNSFRSRKALVSIYSQTVLFSRTVDVRVLLTYLKEPSISTVHTKKEIEVCLFDKNYSREEMESFVQLYLENVATECKVVHLSRGADDSECELGGDFRSEEEIFCRNVYENVALGGTFDRLHPGHKALLSEAIMYCSQRLCVGVTDTCMLKSKKLWEMIEPCSTRISHVLDFLEDVYPHLQYEVVPIIDRYGPTKFDSNLQMIVVSSETLEGGKMINEMRVRNGLSPLVIHVVELLSANAFPGKLEPEEAKVSSTNYRLRLLGTRICTPEVKTHLPIWPYIIGFTGSIGSGKSCVCKEFESLGAGIVDCDVLVQQMCSEGHAGEVSDVLLWPCVFKRAKEEIQKLHEKDHKVIVMKAAMLIQAGWQKYCHELWLCIVSPDVAIKNLQAESNISCTEALARLAAQPSNEQLIRHANVVFSTEWGLDFCQHQVKKAWDELQHFLEMHPKY